MAKESQLWEWLSKAKLDTNHRVDMRRVEDAMAAGFPDVDGFAWLAVGCGPSVVFTPEDPDGECSLLSFKLELKSEKRPKNSATPLRFKVQKRFAQLAFMNKRYQMGEDAYFLLQVGEGAERRIYLAPGDIGARLKNGITEAELARACVSHGHMFPGNVKPIDIIIGIARCSARRQNR